MFRCNFSTLLLFFTIGLCRPRVVSNHESISGESYDDSSIMDDDNSDILTYMPESSFNEKKTKIIVHPSFVTNPNKRTTEEHQFKKEDHKDIKAFKHVSLSTGVFQSTHTFLSNNEKLIFPPVGEIFNIYQEYTKEFDVPLEDKDNNLNKDISVAFLDSKLGENNKPIDAITT